MAAQSAGGVNKKNYYLLLVLVSFEDHNSSLQSIQGIVLPRGNIVSRMHLHQSVQIGNYAL